MPKKPTQVPAPAPVPALISTPKNSPDAFLSAAQGIGTGFENVTAKDLIIPRLTIIQGLSPQVVRTKAEYDPECRVGDIYDVGLGQRFEESIIILPIHYLVQWLEWAPRSSGKGLMGIHDACPLPDYYNYNEKRQMITKTGCLIQETGQLYCLNITASSRPSFIPFASTQLKKVRKLLTLASNEKVEVNGGFQTPPLFYRTYKMTTVPESNADGDWMGWKVSPDKPVTELSDWESKFRVVKDFRMSILKGEVRGDLARDEEVSDQASNQEGAM